MISPFRSRLSLSPPRIMQNDICGPQTKGATCDTRANAFLLLSETPSFLRLLYFPAEKRDLYFPVFPSSAHSGKKAGTKTISPRAFFTNRPATEAPRNLLTRKMIFNSRALLKGHSLVVFVVWGFSPLPLKSEAEKTQLR